MVVQRVRQGKVALKASSGPTELQCDWPMSPADVLVRSARSADDERASNRLLELLCVVVGKKEKPESPPYGSLPLLINKAAVNGDQYSTII